MYQERHPLLFRKVRLRTNLGARGIPRGTVGVIIGVAGDPPNEVEVDFHLENGTRFGTYVEAIVTLEEVEVLAD